MSITSTRLCNHDRYSQNFFIFPKQKLSIHKAVTSHPTALIVTSVSLATNCKFNQPRLSRFCTVPLAGRTTVTFRTRRESGKQPLAFHSLHIWKGREEYGNECQVHRARTISRQH